nr:sulfatase-like hydrolase/transferase [Halomarina rubra]
MRVLVVDIDSLRPDHLGCYGYDRDTAPTVDAIADDGVRFDRCFVSDSPCLPSRTALATCRHGIETGVVTHFGEGQWYDNPGSGHDPDPERPLSFQHLAQNGVRTASVSSFTQRHMAYHFSAGFQEAIQPTAETGLLAVEDGADVTDAALTWLDSHATDDDWLLHVNFWDVHHPYQGIEEYVEPVRESGEAAQWPDDDAIASQRGVTGTRTADLWPNPAEYDAEWYEEKYSEWPMPERFEERADAEHVIDGYDAAIRKVDAEVQRLLDALETTGVREETAIIVTGDHGEALGEHGIYAEHAMPHPPCQRVPLIVSWPGVTDARAGESTDGYVYQFDLMATLCDLFDIEVPAGWDADSFQPALTEAEFDGREFLVSGHGIYTFGRALYHDDDVYIRLYHPGVFSLPGEYNDPDLPNDGLELLHDMQADPHLTTNRIAEDTDRATEMRAMLDRWLADRMGDDWTDTPQASRGRDPLVQMAGEGPYLYVDPDALVGLYERLDRPDPQVSRLEWSLDTYLRDESN